MIGKSLFPIFPQQSKLFFHIRQFTNWKLLLVCSRILTHSRTATSASTSSSKDSIHGAKPVKLAYTSYESTDPIITNSTPVIILHGLLGSKSNWNSISKALYNKTNRKIVNVDARNHGASPFSDDMSYDHMTGDVIALMKDLEIKKAAVIGHSMGGRTAMNLALNFPDAVESLIVLDISPFGISSEFSNVVKVVHALQNVKIEPKVSLPKARLIADRQLSSTISDLAMRQFVLTQLYEDENGNYKWRANVDVIKKNLDENIIKFPVDESLRYHGPTLFITGLKSNYVQSKDHEGIKMLFPKAVIKSVDSGHWPHAEKPAEFLAMASEFLNTPQ
ncbi:unnamed protein product [Bemisia tabaci]|uniref:sn-1-specific diacylglycerol lipase ABHD11 n=1 Tax=Bemisia tabaci TaxID=7038 RepID=A0A9P0F989_BEMTA|nr:unnamed protein product [Bemisia tabaci]